MSALPPIATAKADLRHANCNLCYWPADVCGHNKGIVTAPWLIAPKRQRKWSWLPRARHHSLP